VCYIAFLSDFKQKVPTSRFVAQIVHKIYVWQPHLVDNVPQQLYFLNSKRRSICKTRVYPVLTEEHNDIYFLYVQNENNNGMDNVSLISENGQYYSDYVIIKKHIVLLIDF